MAIYRGAPPTGWGLQFITVCFTGWDATFFRWAISQIQVVASTLTWALVGLIASLIVPDGINQLAGLLIGGLSGAIGGSLLAIWTMAASGCPCPPGTNGFCVSLVVVIVPGAAIPIYPYIIPDRSGCATVMPAGCP